MRFRAFQKDAVQRVSELHRLSGESHLRFRGFLEAFQGVSGEGLRNLGNMDVSGGFRSVSRRFRRVLGLGSFTGSKVSEEIQGASWAI